MIAFVCAIDFGDCLLIGVVRTSDSGDCMIGIVWATDIGDCLLIGVVRTIDFSEAVH